MAQGDTLPGWMRGEDTERDPAAADYTPSEGSTDVVSPRAVAQVIDWAVVAPAVLALDVGLSPLGIPLFARIPIEMTVFFAYCVVLEGFFGGRTVGKRFMGILVVTTEGHPVSVRQALVRNLPALVAAFWIPYIVAIFSVVSTPLHQRVFDRLADTAVVRI